MTAVWKMDILNFTDAGDKLGLKGAELKAWAEDKVLRARAQELEYRMLNAVTRRFELERKVLDAEICRMEPKLNTFHQKLRVEEHASKLSGEECPEPKTKSLELRSGQKYNSHLIDKEAVCAAAEYDNITKRKHFMSPETPVSEQEQSSGGISPTEESMVTRGASTVGPFMMNNRRTMTSPMHACNLL